MQPQIQHEPEGRRFVVTVDGAPAFLEYASAGAGRVDFRYTFVSPALRGRGLGAAVVREALAWARREGLKVVPSCWFVAAIVERHHEYRDLLA